MDSNHICTSGKVSRYGRGRGRGMKQEKGTRCSLRCEAGQCCKLTSGMTEEVPTQLPSHRLFQAPEASSGCSPSPFAPLFSSENVHVWRGADGAEGRHKNWLWSRFPLGGFRSPCWLMGHRRQKGPFLSTHAETRISHHGGGFKQRLDRCVSGTLSLGGWDHSAPRARVIPVASFQFGAVQFPF